MCMCVIMYVCAEALSVCRYPKWAFNKTKRTKKQDNRESEPMRKGVTIPYMAGVSEKLQRIFRQHEIPVYFKTTDTLRQRLVHPKEKTPSHKQSNVLYSIQCSEDCSERYIGETKQLLHKRMYQHRGESSSGPQSAVYLHLKAMGHSFEDSEVQILAREKNLFERGVKEAIFVKKENPSLNRNGGLRHYLSPIYNSILKPNSDQTREQ
ncbi:hypothetical protein NL108_009329 [Boleophthalmus pectinirostris]|nr:hypothetical protein NL108_009329 [Boleophthalmus pectinirostris]